MNGHSNALDAAKLREIMQEDRKFQQYYATLTDEEQRIEADYLYQEGVALAEIRRTILQMSDTTEYAVSLTRHEIWCLMERLPRPPAASGTEQSAGKKLEEALETRERKATPAV